jgi:hypothetical protein
MTEANQTLVVHILCALAIAGCVALAYLTPLRDEPIAGNLLIGVAIWLHGKYVGKPAAPILNRIISKMEPQRVEQIISQRPPAGVP